MVPEGKRLAQEVHPSSHQWNTNKKNLLPMSMGPPVWTERASESPSGRH